MTKMFHNSRNRVSKVRAITLGCVMGLLIAAPTSQASAVRWVESPLAGADHDHDGVRDDVAREIRQQYKPAYRHWPMEIARASQRLLLSDGNPFAIYRGQAEMRRAIACIARQSGELAAANIRDEILQQVLDNEDRQDAYLAAVTLWEDDIRHRDLPSRPDDRWQDGCEGAPRTVRVISHRKSSGPAVKPVEPVALTPKAEPRPRPEPQRIPEVSPSFSTEVVIQKDLPPPNFFKTGERPRRAPPQPAESPPATTRPSRPEVESRRDDSLPGAFRVQPEQTGQKYSAAFGVNYTPSLASQRIDEQRETAVAGADAGPSSTDRHEQAQQQAPELLFDSLAHRPEVPEEAEPVKDDPEVEPGATDQPPVELVDLRPPPDETPDEEASGDGKVVVVVRKGKQVDGDDLPAELRDLAPFIKSYRFDR